MVSPELIRRYAFFCCLDDAQQKAIAMITEEICCEKGTVFFEEGQPAGALYLLISGGVHLYFTVGGAAGKQLPADEINPGEPFGISALIEPYQLTATARATDRTRVLKIDGPALRALCEVDHRLGYALMRAAAKAALERLHYTRIQLAAAQD